MADFQVAIGLCLGGGTCVTAYKVLHGTNSGFFAPGICLRYCLASCDPHLQHPFATSVASVCLPRVVISAKASPVAPLWCLHVLCRVGPPGCDTLMFCVGVGGDFIYIL